MSRLEARDLAFGYRDRIVGQDVSLSVGATEIVCLLGPNGSGKTTLFKTLLGLLPRLSGAVSLDDKDISAMSRAELARHIAYVPQTQYGTFAYTVHDMVLMGRTMHRGLFSGPSRQDHEIVDRTLNQLGISALSGRDYTRISGGQQQMVMIARALVQEAALIVMDEPSAGLDFGNQVLILRQARRLAEAGLGILLSTHNPDHAFEYATRVAVLHQGGIDNTGAPADVLTPELLTNLYGVDVDVEKVTDGRVARARSSSLAVERRSG